MRITATNMGNAVKALRTLRGLSQAELGRRAGVGQPAIAKIESRSKNPSVHTFVALIHALDAEVHVSLREEAHAPTEPRGGDPE